MLEIPLTQYNVITQLITPGALANTAAATSAWVDVSAYTGPILIVAQIGAVTAGSIAAKFKTSANSDGSDPSDVHTFTTVTTSNDPKTEIAIVDADSLSQYAAYVGVVTTGPVDGAVTLIACNQYT